MSELSESELRAVSIATDELQSYLEVATREDRDFDKIEWARRKLDAILVRHDKGSWVSSP